MSKVTNKSKKKSKNISNTPLMSIALRNAQTTYDAVAALVHAENVAVGEMMVTMLKLSIIAQQTIELAGCITSDLNARIEGEG